jgi:hypothetical protein
MAENSLRYQLTFVLTVFFMGMFGAWLGFLTIDREVPTVTYDARAITPVVSPGGELRVAYKMFRRRSCETNVDRFIFDSENVRHVLSDLSFNAGLPIGQDSYTVPVKVPDIAKKGRAVYRVTSSYVCNPIQRLWPIVGPAREIQFEIAD